MSILIIIGYVKDGVDFVWQYILSGLFIDFIEQYYGMMLVEYFYYEVICKVDDDYKMDVQEFMFWYFGLKLQTWEVGVMMLVDSVESVSCTLSDFMFKCIELFVYKVIMKWFLDG